MMKKLLLSVLCLTLLVSATFFVSGCKKKHTHSFTEQAVKDEYLSTAADCTNKATSLVIVDILEGIESLNEYAFYNYSGLGAIRIPITVKEIRKNSIRKVSSTWVYYNGTKEEWGNINISSEVDIKKVLYYSPTKPTTEGNYWYYDSNGNIEEW